MALAAQRLEPRAREFFAAAAIIKAIFQWIATKPKQRGYRGKTLESPRASRGSAGPETAEGKSVELGETPAPAAFP